MLGMWHLEQYLIMAVLVRYVGIRRNDGVSTWQRQCTLYGSLLYGYYIR